MFFRLTQETDGVWQLQGDGSIAKGPLPESLRTDEDLAVSERGWRDAEVSVTEWLVTRHRDEQDMQLATTLPAEQFAELLSYRQALRDWPAAEAFPDSAQRPVAPRWLAEQTQ
ncbi:MAG: phage tail assembly chaperone [Pseudomonas rhizophila]|uniref:phage tail assembly chaperone n=1 Tax=Pseudomonas rhizophila TaxID=2045200 RepID=UPI003F6D1823